MSVSAEFKLKMAREYSEILIIDGHVDADNDRYDGVRTLYQLLHELPVTGKTCAAIQKLEETTHIEDEAGK